jgi:hypothetical protein
MSLPSSGAISMSQVDTELQLSSTAQISLNDTAVRTLLGVPSGQIDLNTAYGKTYFYYYSDGSSLTGWTNNSATINSGDGSPAAPCIQATGGQYAYIIPGGVSSLLNTTITFNMKVIPGSIDLANFFFGCNSSGAGQMLRLEARGGNYSGFTTTSSWTLWNAPTTQSVVTAGVWYSVKIQITSSGYATWYLNGTIQDQNFALNVNSNYIACHGDSGPAGVTGGLFDNIYVYSGII